MYTRRLRQTRLERLLTLTWVVSTNVIRSNTNTITCRDLIQTRRGVFELHWTYKCLYADKSDMCMGLYRGMRRRNIVDRLLLVDPLNL